jgi:hypothetical protein
MSSISIETLTVVALRLLRGPGLFLWGILLITGSGRRRRDERLRFANRLVVDGHHLPWVPQLLGTPPGVIRYAPPIDDPPEVARVGRAAYVWGGLFTSIGALFLLWLLSWAGQAAGAA